MAINRPTPAEVDQCFYWELWAAWFGRQGVALARLSLSELDLAAGRLVRPFDLEIPTQYSYYLAFPPAHMEVPKVKAFRAWVLEEAHNRPVGSGAEPD